MTVLSAVADTFTWIAAGGALFGAITLGLALHRRKLPVHERRKLRFFGRR